ncbi:MAG: prepilin-type N-terminal cleavage/methylation domain-containing protein [Candidatus Komeilibacteria bacterium]|nr:prepilin-type N-terminal cleavage/methylation domain-containing protein [Candidatus Komeilibacteria bacterium]
MSQPLKKSAFTLIELVAVVALGSLIFLLIYQMYDASQIIFKQSNTTLELAQNGRVVLDRLSRELRQAKVIATPLPADKNQNGFPPPNSLLFENGHDAATIQYLRYQLTGNALHRQVVTYAFAPNPDVYVHYDDVDQFGQRPQETIAEDRVIAEYISEINFYGSDQVTIELNLVKKNYHYYLLTTVGGRNALYGPG